MFATWLLATAPSWWLARSGRRAWRARTRSIRQRVARSSAGVSWPFGASPASAHAELAPAAGGSTARAPAQAERPAASNAKILLPVLGMRGDRVQESLQDAQTGVVRG